MNENTQKITKQDLREFLSNFGIYRPGCYDVPNLVLDACIDEYFESGTLECLHQFEKEMGWR
jgi:hypothetical protein